jgi:hypothetical protein
VGWAEVVDDRPSLEVMLWGSRNSGKTILVAVCLLSLAECHGRAGFPLPVKAMWLHSSLVDAAMKTRASLEEPGIWGGSGNCSPIATWPWPGSAAVSISIAISSGCTT